MTQLLALIFFITAMPSFQAKAESTQSTSVEEFSHSREWRRALFARSRGIGAESVIVNADFFVLGLAGRRDPRLELEAMLHYFRVASALEVGPRAPQCRFPFRYKLLRGHFALPDLPPCPEFEQWRDKYQPSGLSLVYASQYISNPSSVFGHSFLVTTSQTQVEALWQTFNYAAAMPEDVSAFSYAWGGLNGWYTGMFSVMPFYQRLFYYGNVENRDLWLYPVKLTADQLDSALRLLWELAHDAKFIYYFLDENCAGELLRTFAALFPSADIDDRLAVYVHPIEIIKTLGRVGVLGPARLLPSQYGVLWKKYHGLNQDEKRQFTLALRSPDKNLPLTGPRVSEAIMEYTAYEMREHDGKLPAKLKPLERRAFLERASFGSSLEPQESNDKYAMQSAPHLAHDSMAADGGVSVVNGQLAGDLSYRSALHGTLDAAPGFVPYSTFEAFKIALSANAHQVWIRELTLLDMENFQPFWLTEPKISWRVNLHALENLLTQNPVQFMGEAKISVGLSLPIEHQLIYGLLVSSFNFGSDLPQGHIQLGPELGFRFQWVALNGVLYIGSGSSLFEGKPRWFLNGGLGLGWAFARNYEFIHETQILTLPDLGKQGYRSGLSVRRYF